MLCTLTYQRHKAREHQDGKCQKMPARKRFRQPFIISGQSAKARRPPKTAFDYPAMRQQHEAFLGCREFYDIELDAMGYPSWAC
jgi:hypothetical protein